MRGYFPFEFSIKGSDGINDRYLALFQAMGSADSADLSYAMEQWLEGKLLPDHIVLICSSNQLVGLENAFNAPEGIAAKNRGNSIRSVSIASFNKSGKFETIRIVRGKMPTLKGILNTNLDQIRHCGMSAILSVNNALVKAPSGFVFAKPSGRGANYFIRSENMLIANEEICFITFCILPYLNTWLNVKGTQFQTLLIDSMSIASLAYCIIHYLTEFKVVQSPPRVISFHSYDGIRSMPTPIRRSAFTIISASSSGALAIDFRREKNRDSDEILTLLALRNRYPENLVIKELEKPNDWLEVNLLNPESGYRSIKIVGEHFLSEPIPPRKILLTKNNVPRDQFSAIFSMIEKGIFECFKRARSSGRIHGIYVNGNALIAQPDFHKWFYGAVSGTVPVSTKTIIYQKDKASKVLAEQAYEYLTKSLKIPAIEAPISNEQLANRRKKINGTVLIIAAVVGRGTCLQNISRDLRNLQPAGNRVFLCGFILAQTIKQTLDLENNLKHAPADCRYLVDAFRKFGLNAEPALRSWKDENRTLRLQNNRRPRPHLTARLKLLANTGEGLGKQGLWPSTVTSKPLELRNGFAFWGEEYSGNDPASVLFTVGLILQYSREYDYKSKDDVKHSSLLRSNAFEQVVLDPEVFARFNDGILQGCLLRMANESELDYSGDAPMSLAMADLIFQTVTAFGRERGEASAEFLLALALGKLRLRNAEFAMLCEKIKTHFGNKMPLVFSTQMSVIRAKAKTLLEGKIF